MIAKVTQRTKFGPLRALPTNRHERVALRQPPQPYAVRAAVRFGVGEAHHAAIRSSSHSSMKAENWFQLRIVGVTTTTIPRLWPGFFHRRVHPGRAISFLLVGCCGCEEGSWKCLRTK
jgi:hypothetical protein